LDKKLKLTTFDLMIEKIDYFIHISAQVILLFGLGLSWGGIFRKNIKTNNLGSLMIAIGFMLFATHHCLVGTAPAITMLCIFISIIAMLVYNLTRKKIIENENKTNN